jgi:hypothetical protein
MITARRNSSAISADYDGGDRNITVTTATISKGPFGVSSPTFYIAGTETGARMVLSSAHSDTASDSVRLNRNRRVCGAVISELAIEAIAEAKDLIERVGNKTGVQSSRVDHPHAGGVAHHGLRNHAIKARTISKLPRCVSTPTFR